MPEATPDSPKRRPRSGAFYALLWLGALGVGLLAGVVVVALLATYAVEKPAPAAHPTQQR